MKYHWSTLFNWTVIIKLSKYELNFQIELGRIQHFHETKIWRHSFAGEGNYRYCLEEMHFSIIMNYRSYSLIVWRKKIHTKFFMQWISIFHFSRTFLLYSSTENTSTDTKLRKQWIVRYPESLLNISNIYFTQYKKHDKKLSKQFFFSLFPTAIPFKKFMFSSKKLERYESWFHYKRGSRAVFLIMQRGKVFLLFLKTEESAFLS